MTGHSCPEDRRREGALLNVSKKLFSSMPCECGLPYLRPGLKSHYGQPRASWKSEDAFMPEKKTIERAREDARAGKASTTQAGEFVREEMHHIREGKHGARNTKQAIAIGLSKARRAGVKLGPDPSGRITKATKRKPSAKRSRAISGALKREGRSAASRESLSRQARSSVRTRGKQSLRQAAAKGVRTKGPAGRKRAAQKAARTRAS